MLIRSLSVSAWVSPLVLSVILLSGCDGGSSSKPPPVVPPTPQTPQSQCDSLSGEVFATAEGNATITATQFILANADAPEHCNVQGSMPPDLHFEVKLPTDWNERLLAIGGGGFDGAIPQPPGYQMQANYVIVATDGGHVATSIDESWALDVEKLNDFAYRSSHKALLAALVIVEERYDDTPDFSYFEGCSNGGREALIQAQRYPNDYDGIIARAPAYNFTWLMVAGNSHLQQFFASAATQLSPEKISTLSNAVLAACDNLDNVADGIVSNYAACTFDPASLLCAGADMDSCLTQPQIDTVNTLYNVHRLQDATPYYMGWPAGGESHPYAWVYWVAAQNTGLAEYSTAFIRYFLQLGASYDPMNFVPDDNLPMLLNRADLIDAASTDYSSFRSLGNKLILWHGTDDWAISFNSSALYYNQVVSAAGGQVNADQFVEFFPAPGVQHCFGGAGPDFVDLLTPLRNWTENAIPPSQQNLSIVEFNYTDLSIVNSRPLCKFPSYPRYNGTGDVAMASSYSCSN